MKWIAVALILAATSVYAGQMTLLDAINSSKEMRANATPENAMCIPRDLYYAATATIFTQTVEIIYLRARIIELERKLGKQ